MRTAAEPIRGELFSTERLEQFAEALALPVTAMIPPGEPRFFGKVVAAAANFRPLNETERTELEESTKGITPLFSSTSPQSH